MLDDFLLRAALAGLGVALTAAPLGCFVIWRRMAFFSDATAHAAILGVALALALDQPAFLGALAIALAMALTVSALEWRGMALDTGLGVLSHSALAVGLVAASLQPGLRIDLNAFLFGDILAVGRGDLALIWGSGAVVLALLAWRWSALLTATLNPELAVAAGLKPWREKLVLTLALALVVAMAIKIVGVLLIGAMLIIPPAAAQPLARSPERMVLIAAAFGAAAMLAGLRASWGWDTPAGPSIAAAAAGLFAAVHGGVALRKAFTRGR